MPLQINNKLIDLKQNALEMTKSKLDFSSPYNDISSEAENNNELMQSIYFSIRQAVFLQHDSTCRYFPKDTGIPIKYIASGLLLRVFFFIYTTKVNHTVPM